MYRKFIDIAPFLMLLITGVTAFSSSMEWYHKIFSYLPDTVGYSIITNLVFLKVYQNKKYCHSTRVAVYGLILMNVVSFLTKKTIYYNTLHDVYITIAVIFVVLYLKNK